MGMVFTSLTTIKAWEYFNKNGKDFTIVDSEKVKTKRVRIH